MVEIKSLENTVRNELTITSGGKALLERLTSFTASEKQKYKLKNVHALSITLHEKLSSVHNEVMND